MCPILVRRCQRTHTKTERTSALSYYDGVRGHTQRQREHPPYLSTTVSEDTHKDRENIRPILVRRCQRTHIKKTDRTSALSYYDGVRGHTQRLREHPPYLSTTVSEHTHKDRENIRPIIYSTTMSEDTHQDRENIRPILLRRCQKTHTKTEKTSALY